MTVEQPPREQPPRVPVQRVGASALAVRVDLWAVIAPGLSIPVPARLRYDPADPYAVHLDCHVDLTEPITWTFARELLATGLTERTGPGDVSVHPGSCGVTTTLFLTLRGTTGEAVLRARHREIADFLRHTERLVPPGAEHERLGLEVLLRRLLSPDDDGDGDDEGGGDGGGRHPVGPDDPGDPRDPGDPDAAGAPGDTPA